ncbi:hypothetical protein [uncultured Tateyamaria sp.]|uniref:hypothetical protein n=1 Tax=Tateyamaria sp. 1078 TaxID=3417464 RepID=UPI00261F3D64|nr:hypothetical protein [uncultured Tateyamaria sp.]
MFVKCLSTAHTSVQTFRFGVIYDIDEKNPKVMKHVRPLLDRDPPLLKAMTKAEVQKDRKKAEKLANAQANAPDAAATAADLRTALKSAQTGEAKALEEAGDAQAKLSEVQDDLAVLIAKLAESEQVRIDEATQAMADLEAVKNERDAALERADKVASDLEALVRAVENEKSEVSGKADGNKAAKT